MRNASSSDATQRAPTTQQQTNHSQISQHKITNRAPGNRGLGLAVCKQLARDGKSVILTARGPEAGETADFSSPHGGSRRRVSDEAAARRSG